MNKAVVRKMFTIILMLATTIGMSAKDDAWEYEIEGAGTGIEGTYLVKVTVISKKINVSDAILAECALRGVLFRGFTSKEFRQHQRPMAGETAEDMHKDFFKSFFKRDLSPFAKPIDGSRKMTMSQKKYRISATVQVFKDNLRHEMEKAGVITELNDGF